MKADLFKDKRLVVSLISTLVWGLIGHAYMFLSSNFSHDSLNAIYAGEAETRWKISVGRFMVVFLRPLFGSICLPWVYGITSLIFIAIATYFIVKLLDLNSYTYIVMTSGILAINITVIAMTATYLYELPFDMLAMLMAVLAVHSLANVEKPVYRYALVIFFVFMCVSLYQSYLCVAIVLTIIYSINKLYKSDNSKNVIKELSFCVKAAIAFATGTGLYLIANKIVCSIYQVTPLDNFNFISQLKNNFINNSIKTYLKVVRRIILPHNVLPKYLLCLACLVLIVIAGVIIIMTMIKKKSGILNIIVVLVLLLVLPLFMNLFGVINYYSHDLMLYATFLIYPFIFKVIEDAGCKILVRAATIASILIIIWNNILVANSCYLKKDIENKAMLSVMTRVIEDLEARDDYEMGDTPIVFDGYGPSDWCIEGFEDFTEITGMYFRAPATPSISWYFDVYKAYFKYVLNYPMVSVDEDTYDKCHEYIEENEVKRFPEDGYIFNMDGVLVINMGIH